MAVVGVAGVAGPVRVVVSLLLLLVLLKTVRQRERNNQFCWSAHYVSLLPQLDIITVS